MKFILIMALFISNFISENHFYLDYLKELLIKENTEKDNSNLNSSNYN
jgi:hypothetical protein